MNSRRQCLSDRRLQGGSGDGDSGSDCCQFLEIKVKLYKEDRLRGWRSIVVANADEVDFGFYLWVFCKSLGRGEYEVN